MHEGGAHAATAVGACSVREHGRQEEHVVDMYVCVRGVPCALSPGPCETIRRSPRRERLRRGAGAPEPRSGTCLPGGET